MKLNLDSKLIRYTIYFCILLVIVFLASFLDDTSWFFETISIQSKIGFLLVLAFFIYTVICTVKYHDGKKELKKDQKKTIEQIVEMIFIVCEPKRGYSSEAVTQAHNNYDVCSANDRVSTDYQTKSGRYYCAWPSDLIMFSIVSVAQYAENNGLNDLQDFCDSIIEDCYRASLPRSIW